MTRTLRRCFSRALLPLAALALVGCDETGNTPVADDALSHADTPAAVEVSETVNTLTIAEFRGIYDPEVGVVEFEMLEREAWTTPENLRVAEQAHSQVRISNGAIDTGTLDADSICFSAVDCGVSGPVFNTLGIFSFNATFTSNFSRPLGAVAAEITRVSSSEYNAYTYTTSGGYFGAADGTFAGPNAPSDLGLGGPFLFGDVGGNSSASVPWAFYYAAGAFSFSGRIKADFPDECDNGIDDNNDGRIDEACGDVAQGGACLEDADCASGFCFGASGDTEGTCELGGCMDSNASNFDGAATHDDGSCTYLQTFYVDANCSGADLSGDNVYVKWIDANGDEQIQELNDVAGVGSYSGVVGMQAGDVSYIYFTGGAGQANPTPVFSEDLTGGSCSTGIAGEYWRTNAVSGAAEVRDVLGACGNCYVIDAFEDNSVSAIGAVSRTEAWSTVMGRRSDFHANEVSVYVTPFQMPNLVTGESVVGATLRYGIFNAAGSAPGPTFGTDLYGLGARTAAIPVAADFYEGDNDASSTLLVDELIAAGTTVPTHDPNNTSYASMTDASLATYITNNYANGEYIVFRLNPDVALPASGDQFIQFLASGAGDPRERPRLTLTTDFSGTPGCVDANANNYDATAGYDDGSCEYDAVFCVDMGCPDPDTPFTNVYLTGPSFSWCADCIPLALDSGTTYCTGTLSLPAGNLEYKYQTDQWNAEENLIGDGACAPITDGFAYANRQVAIDGTTTNFNDTYGSCSSCPQGTITEIAASNADARPHNAFGFDAAGFNQLTDAVTSTGEYYGQRSSPVTPFVLPEQNASGTVFSANVEFEVQQTHGVPLASDLYARIGGSDSDFGSADFYAGAALPDNGLAPELSDWSLVQADFFTGATGAGMVGLSDAGQARLAALLQELYDGADFAAGTSLLVRLSPSDTTTGGWNDVVTYTGDAGADQKPTLTLDQTGLSYGTVPVPGCMDNTANNYNASATTDDGSCIFDVTFVLNTSCGDPALAEPAGWYPLVQGPKWGWDPNQVEGQMTQIDPTTWSVTIPLSAGQFEYKYFDMASQGNVAGQEDLVNDMQGGASCAPITNYFNYANRQIAVTGVTTVSDIYGHCGTCPSATITDYELVATGDDTTNLRPPAATPVVGNGEMQTWRLLVGEYYGFGASAVMPFDLPALADDEYIVSAEFQVMINEVILTGGNIMNDPAQSLSFGADLYGLDYRASGDVLPADHFSGGPSDSANTMIVDEFLAGNHSVGPPNHVTTTASGLTDYLNAQIAAGGNDQWVFLRVNADQDPAGGGWQQFHILSSRAANAVEWPTLNFQTDRCAAGEFVDCSGSCVAGDPAALRGNGTCDDGSTGADLNCARYNYDDSDCGGSCPSGTSLGCDGVTCVNDSNFGNGICDANLDCDDTAYDHFDCTSASQSTCGAGELFGADASCYATATYVATFADGTCQPYETGGDFAYGGGDCCDGGNTVVDCDGNTVCDPVTGLGFNTMGDGEYCDSLNLPGSGNFLCATHNYEGGDCQGECGAGEVPTCDRWSSNPVGTCVPAETMTAALANGTYDAAYDCGWYRFDNGQGGASDCSAQGQWLDCGGTCFNAGLVENLLGDGDCDGGDGEFLPDFACAEWGFDRGLSGSADCTSNLFTNGGFEDGTTGWLTYGTGNWASQETGSTYYGSGDVFTALEGNTAGKQWNNGAEDEQNIFQVFEGATSLTEGQAYMFTGNMFRATQEPFAGSPRVEAWFKYFCAGYGCADVITVPVLDDSSPSNEWVPFSLCTLVPAGRPIQQVGMWIDGGNSGTVWYDDMALEPVASCPGAVNASVASLTHSNTNTYDVIQVTGADTASTPGGTPSADARTVYAYTPDGTGAPTYAGAAWPYVVLPNGAPVTKDGAVAANIGTRHVEGVGRVLTVNGIATYQYTSDNATQMEGAFLTDWHAFTPVGGAVTGTPQVFGCTDTDAFNYDAAATDENGSCTYEVTFTFDTNCSAVNIPAGYIPYIQGNYSGACSAGGTLTCPIGNWGSGPNPTDDDGDGVYTGSLVLAPGNYNYIGTFAPAGTDGWGSSARENLEWQACNCDGGVGACDNRPFAVVDAPLNLAYAWNSCDSGCSAYTVDWCNLQFPSTVSGAAGSDQTAYSQLYIDGLTNNAEYDDPNTWPQTIDVELMVGPTGGDVASFGSIVATRNANMGSNWEYQATAALGAPGTYDYAFRVSTDNGSNWTYCFEDGPQASTGGDRGVATSF